MQKTNIPWKVNLMGSWLVAWCYRNSSSHTQLVAMPSRTIAGNGERQQEKWANLISHVTCTPRTLAPRLPDVCEKNVFHFFCASASGKQHLIFSSPTPSHGLLRSPILLFFFWHHSSPKSLVPRYVSYLQSWTKFLRHWSINDHSFTCRVLFKAHF